VWPDEPDFPPQLETHRKLKGIELHAREKKFYTCTHAGGSADEKKKGGKNYRTTEPRLTSRRNQQTRAVLAGLFRMPKERPTRTASCTAS
jgi:hypothetical protein